MAKQKQSFGVIIATRNIFNFELAVSARKSVLEKMDKMGYGIRHNPDRCHTYG